MESGNEKALFIQEKCY